MGCVHTHQRMLVINRSGNLNHVWNVVEKIGECNWKIGNIGWVVN